MIRSSLFGLLFLSDAAPRVRIEHLVQSSQVKAIYSSSSARLGCVYGRVSGDTAYLIRAVEQPMPCGVGAVATYHTHDSGLSDLDVADNNQLRRSDHPPILIVKAGPTYYGWWSK